MNFLFVDYITESIAIQIFHRMQGVLLFFLLLIIKIFFKYSKKVLNFCKILVPVQKFHSELDNPSFVQVTRKPIRNEPW